ncbi:TPA: hypothetical protein ACKR65_006251 [Pseudomonas aeruginosa]
MNREDVAMDVTVQNVEILRNRVAELEHHEQAEGAQGDACAWLESLEGDAWADACEEIAASVKKMRQQADDEKVEREAFEAHESKERRLSPTDQQFWFRRGAIADYDLKSIDDAWKAWKARAALAQPSLQCKKCGGTGDADSGGIHPWGEAAMVPCDCAQLSHSPDREAFEAWAARVAELEAKLVRVTELERQEPVSTEHLPMHIAYARAKREVFLGACQEDVFRFALIDLLQEFPLYAAPVAQAQPEETPGEILAAKLIETWVTEHGKPAPWSTAVEITAVATNMPNDERDRLLALDDDVDAQAQHSVPDDVETFLDEVRAELLRARSKFPGDRIMTIALAEEFGELCKAVLDEPAANVRKEAVQTAVMAARVVLDGDGSVTAWRAERGLDPLAAAPGKEGL